MRKSERERRGEMKRCFNLDEEEEAKFRRKKTSARPARAREEGGNERKLEVGTKFFAISDKELSSTASSNAAVAILRQLH